MFKFFRELFPDPNLSDQEPNQEQQLQLATATLLIEVMQADHSVDEREHQALEKALQESFDLRGEALQSLITQALQQAAELVSLQHLTRMMNEELSEAEKYNVIQQMWRISFADGVKDRFEEHLIRQVAELLYLPHSQFIQARHQAEASR